SLGIGLTGLHLLTLFVIAPLVRRLPDPDRKRMLRIIYTVGAGVLRDVLAAATSMGFTSSIQNSRRITDDGEKRVVMDIRFEGKPPLRELIPQVMELDGVRRVALKQEMEDDEEDDYFWGRIAPEALSPAERGM